MKHTQLNKNWFPEPHHPELELQETDEGIELNFLLDSTRFEHIASGDRGTLSFINVYAYYNAQMNEEEYKTGSFRFSQKQLPWGAFYELSDSGWEKKLPDDFMLLNEGINKKRLRHFVIFFRDELVECLATDYSFEFEDTISELLEEKYPKGYLNHYLAMFTANFDTPSTDNFKVYTDLYIQMEGKKEFTNLKTEIKIIQSNNDLPIYLKFINYTGIENFGMKQLIDMLKVIKTFKLG